jgi:hypothetical protein
VRAELATTGEDFLRVNLALIREAAATALSALLPPGPPGSPGQAIGHHQIQVTVQKHRQQLGTNMPAAATYAIQVQCPLTEAAVIKKAITAAGCLVMDWGRVRPVRATLFESTPTEAQYLLHLELPPFSPMDSKWLHEYFAGSAGAPKLVWVMEVLTTPEAMVDNLPNEPWVIGDTFAPLGTPTPALDLSFLDMKSTPGRHFLALTQGSGGHPFVHTLFGGRDLSSPCPALPLPAFRLRAWRLIPKVPPLRLDIARAQMVARAATAATLAERGGGQQHPEGEGHQPRRWEQQQQQRPSGVGGEQPRGDQPQQPPPQEQGVEEQQQQEGSEQQGGPEEQQPSAAVVVVQQQQLLLQEQPLPEGQGVQQQAGVDVQQDQMGEQQGEQQQRAQEAEPTAPAVEDPNIMEATPGSGNDSQHKRGRQGSPPREEGMVTRGRARASYAAAATAPAGGITALPSPTGSMVQLGGNTVVGTRCLNVPIGPNILALPLPPVPLDPVQPSGPPVVPALPLSLPPPSLTSVGPPPALAVVEEATNLDASCQDGGKLGHGGPH